MIEEIKNKMFEYLKSYNMTLESVIYKIISSLIFGFILTIYAYLPFLVYMNEHSFFSYDFFTNGIFALNTFSILILFLVVGMVIVTAGAIPPIVIKKFYFEEKINILLKLMLILNVLMIFLLVAIVVDSGTHASKEISSFEIFSERLSWFVFLVLLSLSISSHISIIVFFNAKVQLMSMIVNLCIIIPWILFTFSGSTTKLISNTLRAYGVGGNIPVAVVPYQNLKECIEGNLIFLSPSNIYIKLKEKSVILINNSKDVNIALKATCEENG